MLILLSKEHCLPGDGDEFHGDRSGRASSRSLRLRSGNGRGVRFNLILFILLPKK